MVLAELENVIIYVVLTQIGKCRNLRIFRQYLNYGIDGAGFSAYVLNYQHCLKCVLKNQHSCDEISA